MILAAPAKLNLRLRVLGRQADGYHAIETLLLRLRLADEVALEIGGDGVLFETGGMYPAPEGTGNLCVRAAHALFDELRRPPAARIRLEKRIPVAAGLGGGSSDAAAVLVGLNRLLAEPLDQQQLLGLAGRLGSDVPFFASGAAFALGWGRGERLLPLPPPPSRPVLVIVPDFGIAAADAYAWWAADTMERQEGIVRPSSAAALPDPARLSEWEILVQVAGNDLSGPVERWYPALDAAAVALRAAGALPALLCGSGACVAGIFRTEAQRDAAAVTLEASGRLGSAWRVLTTWTDGPGGVPEGCEPAPPG